MSVEYHSKAIYLTQAEARKAERIRLAEIDEQIRSPKKIVMLLDLMTHRLDHVLAHQSKAHYQETRRYYRILKAKVGNVPVDTIKKIDILNVLNSFSLSLQKSGRTNWNVNSMLAIFKHLFYVAIYDFEVDMKNPCLRIKKFPVENRLKLIPTNEMIEQVLLECDDEERLLIAFLLETGARINEAMRFASNHINLDRIVLYTRKSKNANLTGRKLPLPFCLKGLTFEGRLFKRWTKQPRFLEKIVRKLGQPLWGFHALRHRLASRMSAQGKPLYEIMEILGHSNLETTQIYLQSIF